MSSEEAHYKIINFVDQALVESHRLLSSLRHITRTTSVPSISSSSYYFWQQKDTVYSKDKQIKLIAFTRDKEHEAVTPSCPSSKEKRMNNEQAMINQTEIMIGDIIHCLKVAVVLNKGRLRHVMINNESFEEG